jgi:hypothetical protein
MTNPFARGPMTGSAMEILGTLHSPAAPPASKRHPDAALLRAWADYLDANRRLDALPDDRPEEDFEPCILAVEDAEIRLCSMPARTAEGLALMRWLWASQKECRASYDASFYGAPMPADLISDWRDQLFWKLIADAERMSA